MMGVRCKHVAQISLNNTILLSRAVDSLDAELQEISNKMIEEKYQDHRDEIINMNSDLEDILSRHQNENGAISNPELYSGEIQALREKHPNGAKFQDENTQMMRSVLSEEISLDHLGFLNVELMSDTISGEELNLCSWFIDDSII
jgi:hypothetical protein